MRDTVSLAVSLSLSVRVVVNYLESRWRFGLILSQETAVGIRTRPISTCLFLMIVNSDTHTHTQRENNVNVLLAPGVVHQALVVLFVFGTFSTQAGNAPLSQ